MINLFSYIKLDGQAFLVNPGRRKNLCLYIPGFHRQVLKHVKILSERSKKRKNKKNKGSVFVAESAHNSQNAQFGLLLSVYLTID